MQEEKFLSRAESAEYLVDLGFPTTKRTMDKLACLGGGPKFYKFGSRVLYRPSDLTDWAQAKLSSPMASTCDMGGNL